MVKMEPYIYKWYEYLKQGKLMGVRCKECNTVEFPPLPVCSNCSCTDMEWVEISGDADMYTFAYCPMGITPYSDDPVVCVGTKLKEGPAFMSWIADGDEELVDALLKRERLDEDISWPAIRIKE